LRGDETVNRRDINAALDVVNELIRAGSLTVVVETPEGSNCCPVVSANLNGNNIDVWLDEKFGNEIKR
jgi:hypothetical protein